MHENMNRLPLRRVGGNAAAGRILPRVRPARRRARARPWGLLLVLLSASLSLGSASVGRASDGIQAAGDALELVLPASAAGLTLIHRDRVGTVAFLKSAVVTTGLTYALKLAVQERRPNGGTRSFPSGHTSISFCSAEFARERYGWQPAIPEYLAATFVAYSRVEVKEHYVHDVLAGAIIGIVSSHLFTHSFCGHRLRMRLEEAQGRRRATIDFGPS